MEMTIKAVDDASLWSEIYAFENVLKKIFP